MKQSPIDLPSTVSSDYLHLFDLLMKKVTTYQTTSRISIQDILISLTQFISNTACDEQPKWILSRIHSFPWKSLLSQFYSPFLPQAFQKGLSQFLNKFLIQFHSLFSFSFFISIIVERKKEA